MQFIGLIGGRVCNPRQQQVLSIYLWSLCDYKQIIYNMLLPRVENPPPQLGRQIAVCRHLYIFLLYILAYINKNTEYCNQFDITKPKLLTKRNTKAYVTYSNSSQRSIE